MSKRKRKPPTPAQPRGHCGCRNRRRGEKIMHKSREAALAALAGRRYADGLPHHIYPCPTRPGVFHVGTVRKPR